MRGTPARDTARRGSPVMPRRWPSVLALCVSIGLVSVAGQDAPSTAPPAPARRPRSHRPPQTPPAADTSFRAGVELVSLNVTVTDAAARYVTDLEDDDFQVYEDGVKQDVTFFNRTNLPIALALLVDTSASMESRLPIAQEAADRVRPQAAAAGSGRDHRLRQPRGHPAAVHERGRRSSNRRSGGRPPAGRRRCTTPSTSRSRT